MESSSSAARDWINPGSYKSGYYSRNMLLTYLKTKHEQYEAAMNKWRTAEASGADLYCTLPPGGD